MLFNELGSEPTTVGGGTKAWPPGPGEPGSGDPAASRLPQGRLNGGAGTTEPLGRIIWRMPCACCSSGFTSTSRCR